MNYTGKTSIEMGDGTYYLRRPAKLGGELFSSFNPSSDDSIRSAMDYVHAYHNERNGIVAEIRYRRDVLGY